ncbi:uncharacterized protein LOC110773233 [Prunus avium]|uniref:Uncharacterized protein LOC110773233 n=1 Tax=Prunus avium TaxID=42229 RepID=A0A6P5U2L8_PRUAV|nr:uncharacterized protein LOC110773233 [Prunus avium]
MLYGYGLSAFELNKQKAVLYVISIHSQQAQEQGVPRDDEDREKNDIEKAIDLESNLISSTGWFFRLAEDLPPPNENQNDVNENQSDDIDENENERAENENANANYLNIYDPRVWDNLDAKMRDLLLENGPLFKTMQARSQLASEGSRDWKHLGDKLKQHENSIEHLTNLRYCVELQIRLKTSQTIDKELQELIKKDTLHWKNVIVRIIVVVKCLATHNLAFRGTNEKVYDNGNGIEKIRKFEIGILPKAAIHSSDGLTLKSLSTTRWESHIDSVKAIKSQAAQIRDALFKLAEISEDAKLSRDAQSLASGELSSFDFILSLVIWHNILHKINLVSKKLQSEDMRLDVAVKQLEGLVAFFENYRINGFISAVIDAKEIAFDMGIEPVFPKKRQMCRKRHFDEISNNEREEQSVEESFRVNYFLVIVDIALGELKSRFEQLHCFESIFGFLFDAAKLTSLDANQLKVSCVNLENALKNW